MARDREVVEKAILDVAGSPLRLEAEPNGTDGLARHLERFDEAIAEYVSRVNGN
jgi:hypothetical protein